MGKVAKYRRVFPLKNSDSHFEDLGFVSGVKFFWRPKILRLIKFEEFIHLNDLILAIFKIYKIISHPPHSSTS